MDMEKAFMEWVAQYAPALLINGNEEVEYTLQRYREVFAAGWNANR